MKTYAYIGIAASLLMAVSDVILLGQPVSGSQYDISSLGAMQHVNSLRAAIGTMTGLAASFFICFGYWYLKLLFEKTNRRLATVLFIAMCSVMFFGGAFHVSYYFLAQHGLSEGSNNLIAQVVLTDFRNFIETISWLSIPGFVIGSSLFWVLAKAPEFKPWFRWCNPLVVTAIFLLAFTLLPAPLGGYLKPTFVNVSTALVFWLATKAQKV